VHRLTARYCFLLIVVICGLSVSSAVTANDIATLKAEAERGDSEAQALLGDRFWFGIGIASDSRKAMKPDALLWNWKAHCRSYRNTMKGRTWCSTTSISWF
jgi:hypothetical protein